MAFHTEDTPPPSNTQTDGCCPKTGQPLKSRTGRPWLIWLLPITGLLALVWFLIRVVPKPSRAMYPCQRVAMPLASGFVLWLLGIGASVAAFRKAQAHRAARRYILALAALVISIGAIWIALSATIERPALAQIDPLAPIGAGKGIYPGRVVWVHDPDATNWDGPGDGHLWEPGHTDQAACDKMMSKAIRTLTGTRDDAAAWAKLFRYHNQSQGKGDVAYQPGQKIVIKVNFVGFIRTVGSIDPETYDLKNWRDYMNTSPQMIAAVLKQLTQSAGVKEADIAVGDSLAYFAKEYYDILHDQFPDVRYLDCHGQAGRTKMELSSVELHWSSNPEDCRQDYVPESYAQAEYFINLANLKAHPLAGVTLCAKNHFGSLLRLPPERGYFDMHKSLAQKRNGQYRDLVDLMGHSQIGGKTVLYLIDGLYGGIHYVEQVPRKFKSAPFDNDWTSSLFASQDPVAIDSVGVDFLQAETDIHRYSRMPGTDDYLHEAALAGNPPSGTFYDPDHAGNVVRLASLGVHEHWNNPEQKQYSRNLKKSVGIELIALTRDASTEPKPASIIAPGAKVRLLADIFKFTEGPAPDAAGNVFFTDQPNNKIYKWSVDGKLSLFLDNPGRANGLFFDTNGNLWSCSDMDNELWMIDPQGNVTIFVRDFEGKLLNGPNDLWPDTRGGIYFTDPLYKRRYWNRDPKMQQDGQHVYYLTPDRKTLTRVADDLVQPNGIVGTPDNKYLYVADIGNRKTYRFMIHADGTLSDKTLFCSMGSDGMTLDAEGNLYLTGRGVTVFNAQGEKIEHIAIDEGWTANVCFGGPDRHTLFITALDSLYAIQMRVKGAY
jgi:gluconolactonase